jgi:hypothetical protein
MAIEGDGNAFIKTMTSSKAPISFLSTQLQVSANGISTNTFVILMPRFIFRSF